MTKTIFKVQVPLVTNDPNPQALIYDKKREEDHFVPVTEWLLAQMQGQPKLYFYGYIDGETVVLTEIAPWQDW